MVFFVPKIFLTGGSGFIGKNLVENLKINHSLYLFKRGESVKRALAKFSPDHIIHLAAEIYKEDDMFDSNVVLTYELLKNSLFTPFKSFIYVGSSSEYGRKKQPMKETDYLDPTNLYEATKGCASLLCQAFARKFNKPIMVARPFSVYGKYEPEHRFIPTLIRNITKGEPTRVSNGTHDFIHVDDFIAGLRILMESPKCGEIYNFGTGVQHNNFEVVEKVERALKKQAIVQPVDRLRAFDSDTWVADNKKALSLGWKVTKTLSEGLHELVRA